MKQIKVITLYFPFNTGRTKKFFTTKRCISSADNVTAMFSSTQQPLTIRLSRAGSLTGITLTFSLNILGRWRGDTGMLEEGGGLIKFQKFLNLEFVDFILPLMKFQNMWDS